MRARNDTYIARNLKSVLIPGWLEPLLDHIADDWSNVLVPVIDTISDETLSYEAHSATG